MSEATNNAPSCPTSAPGCPKRVHWPAKVDLFGVQLSITDYLELTETTLQACEAEIPAIVSCHAVHAVVTSGTDPQLCQMVNAFQAVAADGQPVRWALNWFYRCGLKDRVYGPELTLRLCRGAAERGIPIYLCGGSPAVLGALAINLAVRFPALKIAGTHSPPFRELTEQEDQAVVDEINRSGAKLVFIGLGCPKQDRFAFAHRDSIAAVQVCVGAAFDFHAGTLPIAPPWMQRNGLEWVYRLWQEPGRLWKRYFVTNSKFLLMFFAGLVGYWRPSRDQTAVGLPAVR